MEMPTPPAAIPQTRNPTPILALIVAMTAIGSMSLNMLVPALPSLAVTFAVDAGTVQLVLSLYLFGLAVSQLFMGTWSDRFGRRPVLIAGFIIAVLSNFAAVISTHIGELIAARLVQSFGASTGLAVGRAIIRDLYDRDRAAAMLGVVTSVTILSPMIAPVLGGVLDTALGWRSIFVVLGVGSAAVLLYVVLALPETRPERSSGGRFVLLTELRMLAQSRKFLGYVLTLGFGAVPFFTFVGGAPHVIVSIMHYSSAAYGIGFAVVCATFLGGTTLTARFAGSVGVDRLIACGLACIVIGSVLSVLSTLFFSHLGPASIFVPQMLMSFGNGMFMPNSVAGAMSVRPEAAGTASGIAGFAQMGLGAVGAQIVGFLLVGANSAMPMSLMILVSAFSALIPYFLLSRRAI